METFLATRELFVRERNAGYYSVGSFFLSVTLTDLIPLRLIPPVLMSCSMYWLIGLHSGPMHFVWFALLLVLTAFCSTSIVFLISTAVKTISLGNLIATLILLFSMLFGGLLLNSSSIPTFLS
jgi:ABC-type multidrug transport system permease subunit